VAEPPPAAGPSHRNLGFDLLRGYFLFVIIIDHVGSFPSVFQVLTGRGELWASAAEGFVFVSGFLVGRLRGRMVARGDLAGAARKLLRRAALLALWSVGLTLTFTALGRITGYEPLLGRGIDLEAPAGVVWRAVTLRYSYGLHDMLPLYAMCLAASPLVLWAIARGWGWAVAVGSVALWAASLTTSEPLLPSGPFSTASWQVLFFAGVFFGYRSYELRTVWERIPNRFRTAVVAGAVACTATTMVASYERLAPIVELPAEPAAGTPAPVRAHPLIFSKPRLGPGRIAIAGLWLFTLYVLVKRFEPAVLKALGWLLIPLGQRSLYVYIVQALLLFWVNGIPTHDPVLASVSGAAAVAAVWWMIRARFLFGVIPN